MAERALPSAKYDLKHMLNVHVYISSVLFIALSLLYVIIQRLYFHPLSKFPGPKIASITRWYEFYHDVIRDGTYVKHYPVLHAKYSELVAWGSSKEEAGELTVMNPIDSPIVRISPNHVHVNDPDLYHQ